MYSYIAAKRTHIRFTEFTAYCFSIFLNSHLTYCSSLAFQFGLFHLFAGTSVDIFGIVTYGIGYHTYITGAYISNSLTVGCIQSIFPIKLVFSNAVACHIFAVLVIRLVNTWHIQFLLKTHFRSLSCILCFQVCNLFLCTKLCHFRFMLKFGTFLFFCHLTLDSFDFLYAFQAVDIRLLRINFWLYRLLSCTIRKRNTTNKRHRY